MRRMSVLMAVAFVDMVGLMMVIPLLPLYALRLHASASLIGALSAAFPVAQLASSPVWGRVSDRYGRRPALLVGLSASAVAYVIFGFADALWLLFLSRFVQGLGGGTTGVAQAYVADTMAPNERAKALGWLSAATSAGVIIGPALGSFAARGGETAPGLVAAGLCALNVVFAWHWLPESRVLEGPVRTGAPVVGAMGAVGAADVAAEAAQVADVLEAAALTETGRKGPEAGRGEPEPRPVMDAMWDVIRHPGRPAAYTIWIYVIAMLAYNSTPPVFALYLSWRFGINETNIGWFFVVFGGVGVVMRALVVGPLNDRLGEVRTMRLGAVLYGLGYLLLPFAASVPVFLAFQVLLPLGTALFFPANSALVSHHAQRHEFGLMLGVQQSLRGVMSIAGPLWAGLAYDHLGPSVPFFACSVIIGAALVLALRIPARVPAPATA